MIRNIYLNNAKKYVIGKAIDFGCGAGEFLERLPKGSLGLEVIPEIVNSNLNKGLRIKLFDPAKDQYTFNTLGISNGEFETFISMHVFEHLENSQEIIKKIFSVCEKIGVKRIIIIVPCLKGFKSLAEHITYVDAKYLKKNGLENYSNYKLSKLKYFPLNFETVGRYFTHSEMIAIWDSQ